MVTANVPLNPGVLGGREYAVSNICLPKLSSQGGMAVCQHIIHLQEYLFIT